MLLNDNMRKECDTVALRQLADSKEIRYPWFYREMMAMKFRAKRLNGRVPGKASSEPGLHG
jgi:hypothetical protein